MTFLKWLESAIPRREGNGQGLRSIAAVAEKYHGLFQCDYKDGMFTLRVVLLHSTTEPKSVRRYPAVCAGVFPCLFLLNCMPAVWYASRKYLGYVAEGITYEVARDDALLSILRFSATLNAGGSADYSRYIILNKGTGQVLKLADLFQPEANYVFPISREIKAQMARLMDAGEADYFLPGGIWPDDKCFQSIEDNQNFYINGSGQLVIVFEEYEVAPGSMGTPEFVIPTDVLDGLLAKPSILR